MKNKKAVTVKTANGLSSDSRAKAVALLNHHLPAAIDLHAQIKQAHWNVRGAQFIALHELFDDISEEADGWVDTLAERAGALGGAAEGTIQVAVKQSYLDPYLLKIAGCEAHVKALSKALAKLGDHVRQAIDDASDIKDADTADLFTEISREVDQALWKVESHNEPE